MIVLLGPIASSFDDGLGGKDGPFVCGMLDVLVRKRDPVIGMKDCLRVVLLPRQSVIERSSFLSNLGPWKQLDRRNVTFHSHTAFQLSSSSSLVSQESRKDHSDQTISFVVIQVFTKTSISFVVIVAVQS